jgi:LmbE family N-acetylglucosaminyl deacetylase
MRRIAEILASFEALPKAEIATILQGRRPLILAPHPDDESLGCGGLIAAACAAGLAPAVIILTDGSSSHPDSKIWPPAKLARLREWEALQATKRLGLPEQHLYFFRQRDAALVSSGEDFEMLAKQAAAIAQKHGCDLVIGPWAGDPHCDHEAGALLAGELARRCGVKLLSYPVWGWLRDKNASFDEQRRSGWRLNIAAQLSLKKQAIAAHASQYADLITDSPQGFRLPKNLLKIFYRPYEVFIT